MRRVLFFMLTSANGFYERGPWEIDWHNAGDPEFNAFAIAQLDGADLILFGRATYEGMASYWPTAQAIESDPDVARRMNEKPKIVFSRSLEQATWENTRLVSGDAGDEVARLKEQPGRDVIVMGSSDLATSLAQRGLIDEFRILVNPVALVAGKPVFTGLTADLPLRLLGVRSFASGNVLLSYAPRA